MRALLTTAVLALAAGLLPPAPCADTADVAAPSRAPEPTATVPRSLQRGVGQLWVPATRFRNGYAQHFDEHCSAALVTTDPAAHSTLLLSAWHCIEDYRNLSRDLLFETGDGRRHPARVVTSGGSMHGDWAILRLHEALPGGLLLAAPAPGDNTDHAMAGFPRRPGAAATLVLARGCRVTGRDDRDLRSDCIISKGASGGAVVDATDVRRYRGIISRGDAESVSIFVPLARFYRHLRPYLDGPAGKLPGT